MSFSVHFFRPNFATELPPDAAPDNDADPDEEIQVEKPAPKTSMPTQGLAIHISNDAHENFL